MVRYVVYALLLRYGLRYLLGAMLPQEDYGQFSVRFITFTMSTCSMPHIWAPADTGKPLSNLLNPKTTHPICPLHQIRVKQTRAISVCISHHSRVFPVAVTAVC